jgi:O-antigen ligase
VKLTHSLSAEGRLEQPVTYWNAVGILAALGLLACARMAGDDTRPDLGRALAGAACASLGLGLYLTFSRGAIVALACGLLVLAALCPTRRQWRAVGVTVASSALAGAATVALPAVRHSGLPAGHRTAQGLAMLTALVLLALGAAWLTLRISRAERGGRLSVNRVPIWQPRVVATVFAVAMLGGILVGGLIDRRPPVTGATAARLSSVGSNRYEYWRVALLAFSREPLRGTGAAGFQAAWLRFRHIREQIVDAHSLYLETLAELGVVGLAVLGAFFSGVVISARHAIRRDPELASGLIAICAAWAVHAALDWDWEVPAVTLVAMLAAAALIRQAVEDGAGPEVIPFDSRIRR